MSEQPILVVVKLGGGVDALHLVPPHGDPGYPASRSYLYQSVPGRRDGTLDLDGYFSLHRSLQPIYPLFQQKSLAIVHACGTGDRTLSHFEATAQLNRGGIKGVSTRGWLAAHLDHKESSSLLKAVCCSDRLEGPLENATHAAAIPSLETFGLHYPISWQAYSAGLRLLFGPESEIMNAGPHRAEVRSTGFHALQLLDRLRVRRSELPGFRKDDFAAKLETVANLIQSDVGLEAAVVSLGGWDSHVNQQKMLEPQIQSLAAGLSAFYQNLRSEFHRIVVVTISEFGRRVYENNGGGTDHGNGTLMLALGDPIQGGKVFTRWPGISSSDLDENGNLQSTLDYRDVMTEILSRFHGCTDPGRVFPGHSAIPVGLLG